MAKQPREKISLNENQFLKLLIRLRVDIHPWQLEDITVVNHRGEPLGQVEMIALLHKAVRKIKKKLRKTVDSRSRLSRTFRDMRENEMSDYEQAMHHHRMFHAMGLIK